jgi:hypothetical protein
MEDELILLHSSFLLLPSSFLLYPVPGGGTVSILDHFKPVPTMTTKEVKAFLDEHNPEEYNLVDVRQPGEYETEHIPGTKLIPLGELEDRLGELDPAKPTVAY